MFTATDDDAVKARCPGCGHVAVSWPGEIRPCPSCGRSLRTPFRSAPNDRGQRDADADEDHSGSLYGFRADPDFMSQIQQQFDDIDELLSIGSQERLQELGRIRDSDGPAASYVHGIKEAKDALVRFAAALLEGRALDNEDREALGWLTFVYEVAGSWYRPDLDESENVAVYQEWVSQDTETPAGSR